MATSVRTHVVSLNTTSTMRCRSNPHGRERDIFSLFLVIGLLTPESATSRGRAVDGTEDVSFIYLRLRLTPPLAGVS